MTERAALELDTLTIRIPIRLQRVAGSFTRLTVNEIMA